MIKREAFEKLNSPQKEKVINYFFNAKNPGFSSYPGITIDMPAGYSLRIASLLVCEEQHHILKKIFVVLEESNTNIDSIDVESIMTYAEDLKKTRQFNPEKDELWVIAAKKWTYEAYKQAQGKIVFMDMNTLLDGINKYYPKKTKHARKLRNVLLYYGLIK